MSHYSYRPGVAVSIYTLDLAGALVEALGSHGYALVTGPHAHAFLLADVLPLVAERLDADIAQEPTPSGWVLAVVGDTP